MYWHHLNERMYQLSIYHKPAEAGLHSFWFIMLHNQGPASVNTLLGTG